MELRLSKLFKIQQSFRYLIIDISLTLSIKSTHNINTPFSGKGHWTIIYTVTQSFIILLTFLLASVQTLQLIILT